MTTQPPVEEQKATEADQDAEEAPKGWPHQPIQDLEDEERETLLKAGGPVGEAARVAWAQHQTSLRRQDEPFAGNDASGPNSGVGMQEMPPGPPPGVIPTAGSATAMPEGGGTPTQTPEAPAAPATPEVDTPEEEAAETGEQTDRQIAEEKAAARGLEVRDYGTAGQWRVYNPATGQQVPKSALDAPIT